MLRIWSNIHGYNLWTCWGGVTAYLDNTLLRTLTPFPRLITEGIPVGSDSLYVKVYLDLGDYGERKLLYSFTLNSEEFKTIKV